MSAKYTIQHNDNTKASRDASRPWLLVRTGSHVVGRYVTKSGAQRAKRNIESAP